MKLLSTAKIQKVVDQAGTNNVERNMFLTIMLQEILTKQVGFNDGKKSFTCCQPSKDLVHGSSLYSV
jgi:hypothetical protein